MFDGASGGVMAVTKLFSTQASAAATASVGEDVAALDALDCIWHWSDPKVA
jgi:hypothetical protein